MAPLLGFFIEGLTLVCIVGTAALWGIFGFLFVVERQMEAQKRGSGEQSGKAAQ